MSHEHEYFQIEDEDSRLEDKLLEKEIDYNARSEWHQRGIRLPVFLVVCFVQLAFYLVTILYFIHGKNGSKNLDVHLMKLEGYCTSEVLLMAPNPLVFSPLTRSVDPAMEAVEMVERRFGEDRTYWSMEGLPTQEVDDAWKQLLGCKSYFPTSKHRVMSYRASTDGVPR